MEIAVVYVCDANYHELTLYSLASVARSHRTPLDFHLITNGYDATISQTFTKQISRYGHSLFVGGAEFELPEMGSRSKRKAFSYITDTTFLRCAAIESLSGEYDYILYLDGDTLAFKDLNLEIIARFDEPVAACPDMISDVDTHDKFYRKPISSSQTFNGGVLMVNGAEWRRYHIYERFKDALIEHQKKCPYFSPCEPNDQCALNMALEGQWKQLAMTFNVQKLAFQTQAWADAAVRHYTRWNKFLPMKLHRCDRREYHLLCSISEETGLPHPGRFYDGGLSYWLNSIRRSHDIRLAENLVADIRGHIE